MKLTENFSFEEFCNTDKTEFQAQNLLQGEAFKNNMTLVCLELEKLRAFMFRPIYINSGFRCPELNKAVGGTLTSQHTTGGAADFVVKDFQDLSGLNFIFDWCSNHFNYGQLIFETPPNKSPWIHFGIPREGREKTRFIYENGVYKPI